jgi:hypothetical protein
MTQFEVLTARILNEREASLEAMKREIAQAIYSSGSTSIIATMQSNGVSNKLILELLNIVVEIQVREQDSATNQGLKKRRVGDE